MELRWFGPVSGQSGYEQLTRGMVLALDKLGVHIELQPATRWNLERVELEAEDKMRLDRMINQKVAPNAIQVCYQKPAEKYTVAEKKICYTLFETDRCPDPWLDDFKRMDKVWVFSEFNKKYWARSFAKKEIDTSKLDIIPFGIDTDVFHPGARPVEITNKEDFTFLTVGDFTERKNFEGLIEAYVKEFTSKDKVCLIMKVHFGGFVRRYHEKVVGKIKEVVDRFNKKNPPKILFFGNKVGAGEMPSLYTACDCFVLASRGEGLGIPYIEAMACGKPVIATNWGAQTGYINEKNGLLVKCSVRQIDDIAYILKCPAALNHSWAHPQMDELKEKLRWAYAFRDDGKKLGEQGRRDMLERTWQKTALAIIKKVQAIS